MIYKNIFRSYEPHSRPQQVRTNYNLLSFCRLWALTNLRVKSSKQNLSVPALSICRILGPVFIYSRPTNLKCKSSLLNRTITQWENGSREKQIAFSPFRSIKLFKRTLLIINGIYDMIISFIETECFKHFLKFISKVSFSYFMSLNMFYLSDTCSIL